MNRQAIVGLFTLVALVMLFEGAIIAYGTVDEIKASPNPIVQQFLQGSEVGPIPI